MTNFLHDYADSMIAGAERRMDAAGIPLRKPRDEHWYDVITGADCDFWPTKQWSKASESPKWDAEQHIAMFVAVQSACRMIGATDAQRWERVMAQLRDLAAEYADHKHEGS